MDMIGSTSFARASDARVTHSAEGEAEARPMFASGGQRAKVVLFQTQSEFGGAQEISRVLGKGLEEKGHEVHHAFLYKKGSGAASGDNVFFASTTRPTGLQLIRGILRFRAHLASLKPDCVMTFQHYGNLIGGPVAKLAGVKHVVANLNTARAMVPKWLPPADQMLAALGVYDVMVSNSARTSEEFAQLGRGMGERMVRIDHGVEPKRSGLSKIEARARLGLPPGVRLLGCAGRLHEMKNQAAIIAIMPRRPDVHLALAGGGAERDNLVQQAAALGVADRVHFLGEINPAEIPAFLSAIDIFVFPSLFESFGLAVAEAAIIGVPVVSNDLPVLREVLTLDQTASAIFVDANDPDQLNSAIASLLDDPEKLRALTANATKLERHHSLDLMRDKYELLLKPDGFRHPAFKV